MKTKHTQGEWTTEKLSNIDDGKTLSIWSKERAYNDKGYQAKCIAKVGYYPAGTQKQEAEANAKLIAAAPELLEACINLRQAFLNGYGDAKPESKKRIKLAKAGEAMENAIKKATE